MNVDQPRGSARRPLVRRLGGLALLLALLATGVTLGQRALTPDRPPPVSPDCRLPVEVMRILGPPPLGPTGLTPEQMKLQAESGFVDTRTGAYVKDPAASAAAPNLPGGQAGLVYGTYSTPMRRWIPAFPDSIAPGGLSYAWVRDVPDPGTAGGQRAELHRYDLATASDRVLWTFQGSIQAPYWSASGLVLSGRLPAGDAEWWRVDPETGAARQVDVSADPEHLTQLPGDAKTYGSTVQPLGRDAAGHAMFGFVPDPNTVTRTGGRPPEWVFVETAPGRRLTIFKGTATDFLPASGLGDATGIWFGDRDGRTLWHWRPGGSLSRIEVSGLPTVLPTPGDTLLQASVAPAGACVTKV